MNSVETSIDLRYNIAAMYIAILREDIHTVEQAFAVLEDSKAYLTDEDTLDMIAMRKQGMIYKTIGEVYGISDDTAYGRIRRYKKKTSLDGSPKRSSK